MSEALHFLDPYFALFGYCASMPFHTPVCRPLWAWVVVGSLVLASIVLLLVVRRVWRDVMRRRAADRELARRALVDVDAIESAKWAGDQLAGNPELHPDLAGAIRSHINAVP